MTARSRRPGPGITISSARSLATALTTARATDSAGAMKPEVFMPASSSIRCPWPAPRMAPRMRTEALTPREADEPVFGSGVDLGVGEGHPPGHRGDVHDVAAAAAEHPGQDSVRE